MEWNGKGKQRRDVPREPIVSIETSKLLNRVGFDEKVEYYYDLITKKSIYDPTGHDEHHGVDVVPAPTQSHLQRYLRVYHNYNIVPVRVANPFDNHENHVLYVNGREWCHDGLKIVQPSYEACLEMGLKKSCLLIIEKTEQYVNQNPSDC